MKNPTPKLRDIEKLSQKLARKEAERQRDKLRQGLRSARRMIETSESFAYVGGKR